MTLALLTFAAPLAVEKLQSAERAIEALGNPATDPIRAALHPTGDEGVHFASLHAFRSVSTPGAFILFEFSADGTDDEASDRIVKAIGNELRSVFLLATDWSDGNDLAAYLKSHRVSIGNGLFGNPGLPFVGAPGFTVGRILAEAKLCSIVSHHIKAQDRGEPALERVDDVRKAVAAQFPEALAPAVPKASFAPQTIPALIQTGLVEFATTYLWPLGLAAVVAAFFAAYNAPPGFWQTLWTFLLVAGFGFIGLALLVAFFVYNALRNAEAHDPVDRRAPDHHVNAAMFANENQCSQNHMISITQRKPGALRWFTLRLAFWVVGFVVPRYFQPGFLSNIGTIHFARWVTIPGTLDLVFLSNYGGSWESYLEDFITKAHAGLTGIWSNTIGFPRTENLFQKGATDGDRFKRFARHSMVPTRFWYSAYPHLTTATIRGNAAIRAGLSGVMTEDEAIAWLALFGSAARPAEKLVSSDIQSLIFGGLNFLPFGTCLICDALSDDLRQSRAWLQAVRGFVAFNDGRRLQQNAIVTLGLSARGLERLGLPKTSVDTFPFVYGAGMPARARVLGDKDDSAPGAWRWGSTQPDCALLVYGTSEKDRDALVQELRKICASYGATAPVEIKMRPVEENKVEPFGFADGISQPLIRGTYKSLRNPDSIHIVEPGEFILGYPDNRGYIPLTPTLPATADPENKLPLVDRVTGFDRALVDTTRDIGFNGSFLVIRELEQDVGAFEAYCQAEADRLRSRLPPPYMVDAEFIGAKLIGRWKDGSSLVRYPYESRRRYAKTVADANEEIKARYPAIATKTADRVMSRVKTSPSDATPVDPAPPPPAPPQAPTPPSAADETPQAAGHPERQASPSDGPATHAPAKTHAAAETHAAAKTHAHYSRPDNDFLFGAEDPEGMRCPYGSHMRRANPRDSLDPGSADEIAVTNKHRIIRVGRHYDPAPGANPGLFFMCLCADIERQFEFLQQTWLKSPSFHGLDCEKDPVMGDGEAGNCGYTIPSPDGPIALSPMSQFVKTRGGGYFFLPGRRLIDFLVQQ